MLSFKCLDVIGSFGLQDGSSIVLSECEGVANGTDQKWNFTRDGFIVNQFNNKCLDVKGSPGISEGSRLVLWPCERNYSSTDQKWTLTSEGFLRNDLSSLCVAPSKQGVVLIK